MIEDYEEDALLLQRHLGRSGFRVDALRIETAEALGHALSGDREWDLIIADYTLPGFGAREALELMQQRGIDVPFIIVSGTIDEVSAVNAMRAGAHDYVLKGHLERLIPAIERELHDAEKRRERLRTERELQLLQQRFSATFNQAAVGMAHTTTDGRFVLVNQRLSELLGVPVDRMLALNLKDFILPSERDADKELYAELVEGRRTGYRSERNLMRHDGSVFPAQLTVSLLLHGSVGHDVTESSVLWVVEDISARKAAERETSELMQRLINSERLAAAGRMANTLAHEINNPLEALTNIFYLLDKESLTLAGQELIAIAARELDRVGHITRSTLSFYRKMPGRTLDLQTLLTEVVQLFQSRATQHQIHMDSFYGPGIDQTGYDPALRQVFANLVGNALEAMETSGGRIRIRARIRDGHAVVTVSDTGHGIDGANLQTVFEPFFTTKGERGTGLGLWVTRGIVEEQGGTLQLRSATRGKYRGTIVRITLPAAGVREPAVLVN
ncbi:hybrid sensor histidine kinase/response regulator [Bryocella elongata]|nr:hybrid sensor histidine kinase/response regulator [Bryocella elongata]